MKSVCIFAALVSLAVASPINEFDKLVVGGANLVNDARNGINYGLDRTLYNVGNVGQHLITGAAKGVYDVSNAIGSRVPKLRPYTNKVDYLAIDGDELGHKILEAIAKTALKAGTDATGFVANTASKMARKIVPASS